MSPTLNRWPLICLQSWLADSFHVCSSMHSLPVRTLKCLFSPLYSGKWKRSKENIFFFLSFFKAKLFFNSNCQKCSKRWWIAEAHPLHFNFHRFLLGLVCAFSNSDSLNQGQSVEENQWYRPVGEGQITSQQSVTQWDGRYNFTETREVNGDDTNDNPTMLIAR